MGKGLLSVDPFDSGLSYNLAGKGCVMRSFQWLSWPLAQPFAILHQWSLGWFLLPSGLWGLYVAFRSLHAAVPPRTRGSSLWPLPEHRIPSVHLARTSVGNQVPPFSLADCMADRLGLQPVGLTTGGVPTLSHMTYHTPTHRVGIWRATCLRKSLPRQQSANRWHALPAGKRGSQ
jgi:hypothetical protein